MKFTASRLSKGNKLFPAEIYVDEAGLKIILPGFLSGKTQVISYDHISSVEVDTPMVGYATLRFFHSAKEVIVHGFTKKDAESIEQAINEAREKCKK